jgi:hypothetical protein
LNPLTEVIDGGGAESSFASKKKQGQGEYIVLPLLSFEEVMKLDRPQNGCSSGQQQTR